MHGFTTSGAFEARSTKTPSTVNDFLLLRPQLKGRRIKEAREAPSKSPSSTLNKRPMASGAVSLRASGTQELELSKLASE
eukprot:5734805-Alexandrium_andersonii.AAC.1